MKLEWYRRQMHRPLFSKTVFWRVRSCLSLAVAAGYGVALIWLLLLGSWLRLAVAVAVPATVVFLVGGLREKWDAPRPFAQLQEQPLRPHEPGCGCPSRHTASAVILCWTMLLIPGWWGWVLFGILLVLTGLIGSIRVFTGMHFLRDVLLGAGISCFFGVLFDLPVLLFH